MLIVSGCATSAKPAKPSQPNCESATSAAPATQALRSGRYTLVELVPDPAQQDLMQQIVDVTVPATASATVGDALRYLLLRSGYQLCDPPGDMTAFDALPLPAAHIHIGPLTLRDALRVLAGTGWRVQIDDPARRVCFVRVAEPESGVSRPIPESQP
jgi:type IV pili sensor histidine kinase/response regulator